MRTRTCWTVVFCLGLMTLFGGSRGWAADPERRQVNERAARMKAEGWKQISEDVFERQRGPNKVEHLGYGREGLAWTVGDLTRRLERLQKEQELYPSEKLSKIIADLTVRVARAKRDLWNLDQGTPEGLSSMTEAITGGNCSNICYSATADAYFLTATQGVAAVADAKFNSTCGYSGDTFAFAYARATQGTTTNTVSQSDPRTGTSVNSQAVASANGGNAAGIPCYSEASAYAQSSALGIHYATSDTNSSCPVPACAVTISGTSYEYFIIPGGGGCRSRTWTANVSGCTASTYQWKRNGTVVGTGSTYTQSICSSTASFQLEVTVNGVAVDTHDVFVEIEYCECCNGQICP